ncbi:Ig-like domain-containing protein [Flavobacterium sp.]|uniref:Ig-like domain-containing protein n=1 Tax=Flavobacterium sp. TaxID=239 RepID=UPI00262EBF39|nr:Ig-like domain-containing protein [Flavobacterium sp.]
MRKQVAVFASLVLLTVLIPSCARRGSISGGPKDTIPPRMLFSIPKNLSTNFNGNEIRIQFDEYVKLKDIQKQLVVSPPMKIAPEVSPQTASKTLTIKIKDTLKPNTTYSFNFGRSIQDNNEGNPYPQFRYVVATGPTLDSLQLSVKIKDALAQNTDNFVSIMLYEVNDTYNDSIVFKKPPQYIVNSLDSLKIMRFENIKAGKYRLIAVTDLNKNNTFDPKNEKIGFQKDIVSIPNDTVFELELFKERKPLKITTSAHVKASRVLLGHQGTLEKNKITLNRGTEIIPHKVTKLQGKDSVEVWFAAQKNDSLTLTVLENKYKKQFGFRVKDFKKDSLSIAIEPKGTLHFRDTLRIRTSIPLQSWEVSKIKLYRKDSTLVNYKPFYSEINKELALIFDKEPNQKYKLHLLPGALLDDFGKQNDTIKYETNTLDYADYGNLKLVLQNVKRFPILVELTDKTGKILASSYSEKSNEINFDLVQPNAFTVRIIYDDDKDQKWTPGNFIEQRQSEEVFYYPETIDVRMNWDAEQLIDLNGN